MASRPITPCDAEFAVLILIASWLRSILLTMNLRWNDTKKMVRPRKFCNLKCIQLDPYVWDHSYR